MPFKFGVKSEKELEGVHPHLVRVVRLTLELSPIDFAVHDGLRTLAEQQEYVRTGVSWTLKGRHLSGHAVDLVPYINGKLRWEWTPIYVIAEVFQQAARTFDQTIRWGGVWDKRLEDLTPPLEEEVRKYSARERARKLKLGRKPTVNIDGPHFELPEKEYPAP